MNSSTVMELAPTSHNARNSEGAFIALKNGDLMFAWTQFCSERGGDDEPSVIASRISHDRGKTWDSEVRILTEPQDGAHNVMSVSLARLKSGRILLFYLCKKHFDNGAHQCRPYLQFSDDEMATLSSPQAITQSTAYHVVNNDRVIQLEDSTLVIPIAHHRFGMDNNEASQKARFKGASTIFHLLSKDGGQNWTESTNNYYRCFPDGNGLQEPGVIQLKDGTLWSWTRTNWNNGEAHPRQWQSFSKDNGNTWSEPQPSDFVSPCSPLSMKRIPATGDLLAVWNDHSGRFPVPGENDDIRSPLISAVSSDEGKTWKHHQLVEESLKSGYCYTAIHFTDNAVLLAYCAGGPKPEGRLQRLRIRRIELDEIYGGG